MTTGAEVGDRGCECSVYGMLTGTEYIIGPGRTVLGDRQFLDQIGLRVVIHEEGPETGLRSCMNWQGVGLNGWVSLDNKEPREPRVDD